MRNYLYKDNSARIYMLFKFYRTAIIYKEWIDQISFDLPSDSRSIEKYYLYADHLEIVYHNPCRNTSEQNVDAHSF